MPATHEGDIRHEFLSVTAFCSRYLRSHAVSACHQEDLALRELERFEPDVLLLAQDHNYSALLSCVWQGAGG